MTAPQNGNGAKVTLSIITALLLLAVYVMSALGVGVSGPEEGPAAVRSVRSAGSAGGFQSGK